MSDLARQYDDLWSTEWGDMQRYGPVHRHQRRQLLSTISELEIRSVLEIGCGSGDNLAALAVAMPHLSLSGADLSPSAVQLAKRRVPTATFEIVDAQRETETPDRRFDLVMAIQVIEHIEDDVSALRHMSVRSSGWVLATTMRGRMRPSEKLIGHLRNYSDQELRRKAALADLEVVDIFGWGFPFYSPLYRTAAEWVPGGPPGGKFGATRKAVAHFLYGLYFLNIPRFGDVVTMLARPKRLAENHKTT